MVMKTVSVAVMKQKLSSYLHLVEAGEEIVVTAHRRPVAHVVPHVQRNLRVRVPTAKISILAQLKGVTPSAGRTSVDILLEDRSRR
jgi:prevent-host-death family protein